MFTKEAAFRAISCAWSSLLGRSCAENFLERTTFDPSGAPQFLLIRRKKPAEADAPPRQRSQQTATERGDCPQMGLGTPIANGKERDGGEDLEGLSAARIEHPN
jgi:hypothetical protein